MKRWARRHPYVIAAIVAALAWIVPQGLLFTPNKVLDFAVSLLLGVAVALAWNRSHK